MKITPLDIQQQQFKKKRNMYDAVEVDAFLEMVRLEMEELVRANTSQVEQIKQYKSELFELKSQEKLLREAIISTQKASDEIRNNARKEGDILIAEAKMKGEQILDQARLQVERLHGEIADLRRERIHLEAKLRAILDAHIKLLDAGSEETLSADQEMDKVAVMGKKS